MYCSVSGFEALFAHCVLTGKYSLKLDSSVCRRGCWGHFHEASRGISSWVTGSKPCSPQSSFRVSELFLNLDCKLPEGSNQVLLLLYFLKYWTHSRYSINTCYLFFSVKFLWLFFQVAGFQKMVKGIPVLQPVFVPGLFAWSPNTSPVFPVNIFIF